MTDAPTPERIAVNWSVEARADLLAIDRDTRLQILHCFESPAPSPPNPPPISFNPWTARGACTQEGIVGKARVVSVFAARDMVLMINGKPTPIKENDNIE